MEATKIERELPAVQQEKEGLDKARAEKEATFEKFEIEVRTKTQQLRGEKDAVRHKLVPLQTQSQGLRSKLENAEHEIQKIQGKAQKAESDRAELNRELRGVQ